MVNLFKVLNIGEIMTPKFSGGGAGDKDYKQIVKKL
ncbi:MAG: hypothetical protein CM1200mP23_3050 [Nitrososphaerota archaeon]|nr:MAG: hypothetical protein CM1200mP23_3050 [Nitrososphaerota archaeon]